MECQFKILGPVEAELEAARLAAVPRGRVLSFLALLLVHRGTAVHPDRAVEELWDGEGPQNARNAVHVVASRLRAALGDGVVVSRPSGYAVRLTAGSLDADRFEERFRRGVDELARDQPWEAGETLREALALWRGPALAEVRDERFAQAEIARLDDLYLTCVSERVEADLGCGRHAELAGELEALVREHPLRERLRGQRMLALYRDGRQAEALAEYRSAHRALVDGLGIEPSPRLRALETAILRHELPAPRAARRTVALDARRRVTCVVAQLVRPDAAGELDPESHRAVLERYHETACAVFEAHGGSVTELRGDAAVAVFGIPVAHEDDAHRALRAAVELGARAGDLPFDLCSRCGISTGDVVAPARTAAAPVIGEAVAAAERLARQAAAGEVRIAEPTWRLVRHGARAAALPAGGYVLQDLDSAAPAIERRLDRPLVGREPELARLREAFAAVIAGPGARLLTILGEPGIGKSRLVAELATIAGEHCVLTARCRAYGEGLTYAPLREIVLQAARQRSIDELAEAIDLPAAVAHTVAAAVGIEAGEAGEETAWAFRRLIEALARERPLAIVIDDAHWAEPALLDLLRDAVARLRGAPVLVVWVARPDGLAAPAADGDVVTLGPLSGEASEGMLADLAGGRLDAHEEHRIAEAAGGNPLFLEQLVAYVGEDRPDVLPPAIQSLLAARLDRLDTAERSTLALGAVAGDAFETAAVHALAAGLTRPEVEQACDRLVARELLARDHGGARDGGLRFRHALIRDAAYASLAKSARARLHERHATWLADFEDALPDADAQIGFQLETACRLAQEVGGAPPPELAASAGRRLAAAARLAHDRGDLPGQIGLLERAVALFGNDRDEGVELLPALVSALFESGASARAEELAELAVSAGAALGLTGTQAVATLERERIRLSRSPETALVEPSLRVAQHCAATLRELGDAQGLARAEYLMCDLRWLQGDPVRASAHAEAMLGLARECGSRFDAATAIVFLGWNLVEGPCPAAEAIERCDVLLAEAAEHRAAELSVLGCRAVLSAMTGDYGQARTVMAQARQGLYELGWGEMAAYLALLDAMAETLAGDAAAAERAVRDAGTIAFDAGDRWFLSTANVDLAHAILAQGRSKDTAEAVARIETVPAPGDAEWVIKRHTARALLAAATGDHEAGLAEARAAVAVAEPTTLAVFSANAHRTLAEVLQAAGQLDDAAAAARRALALDDAKGNGAAATATRRRFGALLSQAEPA